MDPAIFPDPYAWIAGRLADLRGMLREAGYPELADDVEDAEVRQAMPAILENIRATLRYRPADRADVPA
jgi:hypothetical protein